MLRFQIATRRMSLDRFATGSPLSSSFPTPSDPDQWLAQDFADDLFGGANELGQALSGKDNWLEVCLLLGQLN